MQALPELQASAWAWPAAAHLLLVLLEGRCGCILQRNRQRSNLMVVGTALQAGKDCRVDSLLILVDCIFWLALSPLLCWLGSLQNVLNGGRARLSSTLRRSAQQAGHGIGLIIMFWSMSQPLCLHQCQL